jgi:hypothetical protein
LISSLSVGEQYSIPIGQSYGSLRKHDERAITTLDRRRERAFTIAGDMVAMTAIITTNAIVRR